MHTNYIDDFKMENINTESNVNSKFEPVNFPVPYTLEQVRESILVAFFHQSRNIGMLLGDVVGVDTAWRMLGKTEVSEEDKFDILNPDMTHSDCNVTYNDIKNTNFAKCIENMYLYGYLGIQQVVLERMAHESIYMWVSACLEDMVNSSMFEEWGSYGSFAFDEVKICLEIAELANARRTLEGNESFYSFGKMSKGSDDTGIDNLTIRQMALLAGMEEMSIRAAANPKRANPIPTYSEDGKTRISIEDAKKWLQDKNRYVPIKKRHGEGDFDLNTSKFKSINDFQAAMSDRVIMISLRDAWDVERFNLIKNKKLLVPAEFEQLEVNQECVTNTELLKALAEILEFPYELLSLRAREAFVYEELVAIEHQLKALQAEKSNSTDK